MGQCQCFPKPQPNFGHEHCAEAASALPRQCTSFSLDQRDRGNQISVFIGKHHKVQMMARGAFTVGMIQKKTEEVLAGLGMDSQEMQIQGLIHRHQLSIYHVLKHGKQVQQDEVSVETLDENTPIDRVDPGRNVADMKDAEFDDYRWTVTSPEGRTQHIAPEILKHRLVAALESIHFLALTDEFDVEYYNSLEEDPNMRFVDHMGMEDTAMYWAKEGNKCVVVEDPLDEGANKTRVSRVA